MSAAAGLLLFLHIWCNCCTQVLGIHTGNSNTRLSQSRILCEKVKGYQAHHQRFQYNTHDLQARLQRLTETSKRLEVAFDSNLEDTLQTCHATLTLGPRLRQALKELEAHVDWASSVILKSVYQVSNPLPCIPIHAGSRGAGGSFA